MKDIYIIEREKEETIDDFFDSLAEVIKEAHALKHVQPLEEKANVGL